jgi:hypothetical protein
MSNKERVLQEHRFAHCVGGCGLWEIVTFGATVTSRKFELTDKLHGKGPSPKAAWADAASKL